MSRTRATGWLSVTVGALSVACGTTNPPPELLEARVAYERASKGVAAEFSPAELHVAKEALEEAEKSFAQDGESQETRDRAYVAGRRAEMAEVHGSIAKSSRERGDAERQVQGLSQEMQRELARTKRDLAHERQAREAAEKKAQQLMTDLQKIAAVKQETRGTVITLSGAVLFASGKSALLPGAMVKLNEVADALVKGDPESKILVEGHTDSQGQASFNRELSRDRAESVRSYLISRGIASDRIRALGLGSERPIAENSSPEGRANNRRVEIVVEPK